MIDLQPTLYGDDRLTDLLPYIRGDGRIYALDFDIAGRQGLQTLQTQYDRQPGVFYQVKDTQWERLYWDKSYIYRHADTSEADDRYYVQTTEGQPGAVWCPRHMAELDKFEREPHVIHYHKADGSIRTEGTVRSTIQFMGHRAFHTYPSGITVNDLIVLAWIVDCEASPDGGGRIIERYHYARGYGLVAWDGREAGHSHISAYKAPSPAGHHGHAPGLTREPIASLAEFDVLDLYYSPSGCYTPEITTPGIDISKWQGPKIDWPAAAATGIKYAFIRASYGRKPDPRFRANVAGATAAGLHTGAYHYLHADKPVEQAQFFYDQTCAAAEIREKDIRENCIMDGPIPLLNVLDVEGKGKTGAVVKAFLDEYVRLTGRKPLIYTAAYIWNNLPDDTSWAGEYDLWVANYTPQPQPYLPRDWKTWVFWQHTSTFSIAGFPGQVDHNRFNGSYGDLVAYLQRYWSSGQP